uniref:DUF104 domain-containing protein n=1 Tax=Strongyloides papillosus TaxID=174720 RepID=A0A0N5C4K4_STREA
MNAVTKSGVILNIDNDRAEKLIKIHIDWPKLDLGTPREKTPDTVSGVLELFSRFERLEDNLVCSCKITRSLVDKVERISETYMKYFIFYQ